MFTHPAIATALADEHRRTMVASAESARLARTARDGGRSGWPVRWFPAHRRPGTPTARKGLARLRPARAREQRWPDIPARVLHPGGEPARYFPHLRHHLIRAEDRRASGIHPQAHSKGTVMILTVIFVTIAIFLVGTSAGIVAVTSLASLREDRAHSMSSPAGTRLTRGARVLTGLYVRAPASAGPIPSLTTAAIPGRPGTTAGDRTAAGQPRYATLYTMHLTWPVA